MAEFKKRGSLAILIKRRNHLRKLLFDLGPILRGSVVTLGIKCSNPNCKCAKGKTHPSVYFSITRKGKTRLIYLGKWAQVLAGQGVANYERLKELVDQLTDVNLEILLVQRFKQKGRR